MTSSDTHDNGREEQWRVGDPDGDNMYPVYHEDEEYIEVALCWTKRTAQAICDEHNNVAAARAQAGLAQEMMAIDEPGVAWCEQGSYCIYCTAQASGSLDDHLTHKATCPVTRWAALTAGPTAAAE